MIYFNLYFSLYQFNSLYVKNIKAFIVIVLFDWVESQFWLFDYSYYDFTTSKWLLSNEFLSYMKLTVDGSLNYPVFFTSIGLKMKLWYCLPYHYPFRWITSPRLIYFPWIKFVKALKSYAFGSLNCVGFILMNTCS